MGEQIVDPDKSAIIVVDMQKDFCCEDGALFVGAQVNKIKPNIKKLMVKASTSKVPVILTQDWHTPDDPEFSVWGKHCVQDTDGAKIIEELPLQGYIVRKKRYSAFFGTYLDSYLREKGVNTLIIVGVVTNICVLHTASDARLRGYDLVIPRDCVAALNDYDQDYALHHISFLFQGKIVSSSDIEFRRSCVSENRC